MTKMMTGCLSLIKVAKFVLYSYFSQLLSFILKIILNWHYLVCLFNIIRLAMSFCESVSSYQPYWKKFCFMEASLNSNYINRRFSCRCRISLSFRGPKWICLDSLTKFQFICLTVIIVTYLTCTLCVISTRLNSCYKYLKPWQTRFERKEFEWYHLTCFATILVRTLL